MFTSVCFGKNLTKHSKSLFFFICASLHGVSVIRCVQILTFCGQYSLSYETVSPRLVIKNQVKDSNFLSLKNLAKDSKFLSLKNLAKDSNFLSFLSLAWMWYFQTSRSDSAFLQANHSKIHKPLRAFHALTDQSGSQTHLAMSVSTTSLMASAAQWLLSLRNLRKVSLIILAFLAVNLIFCSLVLLITRIVHMSCGNWSDRYWNSRLSFSQSHDLVVFHFTATNLLPGKITAICHGFAPILIPFHCLTAN